MNQPEPPVDFDLPDLPSVPVDNLNEPGGAGPADDDIDFDDLTRRFEELKKKK
jgi:vacuolar protein sorting-associated protein IST1